MIVAVASPSSRIVTRERDGEKGGEMALMDDVRREREKGERERENGERERERDQSKSFLEDLAFIRSKVMCN